MPWRFQYEFAQEFRQRPGLDVLHGDGPLLGAGHRLFGDEQNIALLHFGGGVLHHHVGYFVGVGDDMGLDAQAAVLFALRLYGLFLSGIYYHWFFGSFPWVFLR